MRSDRSLPFDENGSRKNRPRANLLSPGFVAIARRRIQFREMKFASFLHLNYLLLLLAAVRNQIAPRSAERRKAATMGEVRQPQPLEGALLMSDGAVHTSASLTRPALYFAGDDGRLEGDARQEQGLHVIHFYRSAEMTDTFGIRAEAEVSRAPRYVGLAPL